MTTKHSGHYWKNLSSARPFPTRLHFFSSCKIPLVNRFSCIYPHTEKHIAVNSKAVETYSVVLIPQFKIENDIIILIITVVAINTQKRPKNTRKRPKMSIYKYLLPFHITAKKPSKCPELDSFWWIFSIPDIGHLTRPNNSKI